MPKQPKSPLCVICGENNPDKFYGHKKSYCGDCHNKYTRQQGQIKREYALSKLGGKCLHCGYDRHSCALDIHHLDPSQKDEKFHGMRGWSIERIDREIAGCILLCKNCHAIEHFGV